MKPNLLQFALIALLFAAALLAACGETPATVPQPSSPPTTAPTPAGPDAALEAIQAEVARRLGVEPGQVQLDLQPATWPDSCLGITLTPEESCLQVVTPGYGGLARVGDLQYEVRASQDGTVVVLIPGAALSARQVIAQQLHVNLDAVRILSFERVDWPDACLGVLLEGEACTTVITPGYIVLLQVGGQTYKLHTDETGGTVRLAAAPTPQIEDAALTWKGRRDGFCQTAVFGAEWVAFGRCGGALIPGQYALPERAEALAYFVRTYAPFTAETPAGRVNFTGQGTVTATPAEQRLMAEWAQLAALEASLGRSGASYGLALTWHREGGIAGFCDDVSIYVTGEAYVSSCRGDQPRDLGRVRLNSSQLQDLYTWMDTLKGFEFSYTDPATADAMTVSLLFSGMGPAEAADADLQAMQALALDLLTQASVTPNPADLEAARTTLLTYFDLLSTGRYAEATAYYGRGYEVLIGYNPSIDPTDHAALFQAACTFSGLQCLPIRNVVHAAQLSPGDFRFTVEFQNADGGLFALGPCCGADPGEAPPQTQFDFTVKRVGDEFLVQELPVYMP